MDTWNFTAVFPILLCVFENIHKLKFLYDSYGTMMVIQELETLTIMSVKLVRILEPKEFLRGNVVISYNAYLVNWIYLKD